MYNYIFIFCTDYSRFIKTLKTKFNLVPDDVEGDGNCLPRTLAKQYLGDETKHVEVRSLCVQQIRNNSLLYLDFFLGTEQEQVIYLFSLLFSVKKYLLESSIVSVC